MATAAVSTICAGAAFTSASAAIFVAVTKPIAAVVTELDPTVLDDANMLAGVAVAAKLFSVAKFCAVSVAAASTILDALIVATVVDAISFSFDLVTSLIVVALAGMALVVVNNDVVDIVVVCGGSLLYFGACGGRICVESGC